MAEPPLIKKFLRYSKTRLNAMLSRRGESIRLFGSQDPDRVSSLREYKREILERKTDFDIKFLSGDVGSVLNSY